MVTVTTSGIEFNGRTYDNPSSAGIAAKESVGTNRKSANTIMVGTSGRCKIQNQSVNVLRSTSED